MKWTRRMVLPGAAGVLLAVLAAAGCGGDDDGDGVPTAPVATSTVVGEVTPFPTPRIEGNSVTSESKGYAVEIPDGWRPRINLIQTLDGSTDAYFEPLIPGATVQANITVTCVPDKAPDQEGRITALKTRTARIGLSESISEATVQIAGMEAPAVSYTQTSEQNPSQPRLEKVDIYFSGPKCDYTVTTTVHEGDRAKYQAMFDAFIASFRLID